jgi:hypothetical protein
MLLSGHCGTGPLNSAGKKKEEGGQTMRLFSLIPIALSASLLAAPATANTPEPSALHPTTASTAKDMSELRSFVASLPTPEEFQQAFPDVWLVLPGDIVSRSFCSQYYRFIAELDGEGRISGGILE